MIRLRHLAGVNPSTPEFDRLANDAEIPFVPLEAVWRSGVDASRRKTKDAALTGYTRFLEGDIVVPKITPTFQADRSTIASGIEGGVAAGTTELHVVRAARGVDARYLRYLLSSHTFLRGGEAEMIGVAGQKRVPDEWIRNMPVHVTDYGTQRAIADHLDTETVRIDALIAKKRRTIDLLRERLAHSRSRLLNDVPGWPLKRLLAAPMAYGVLVPRFVQPGTGVPMMRISNLDMRGDVRLGDVRWVDNAQGVEFRRTRVSPGDLVLSVVGSMGRAAVVPPTASGFNLNRPLARLQPRHDLPSRLLWHWTQTASFQDQARLATGSGAAQPTLNLGDLANFRVGLPVEPQLWAGLLLRVEKATAMADATTDALSRQIGLLIERRQALITAAVTGEVGIPGVAA